MAISRSLMERQLRAGGGIMTLEEPRQGYFLGKIVKKAKRVVKKVAKSKIGKAALAGAALYGLGAFGAAGAPGSGGFLNALRTGGMQNFGLSNLGSGLSRLAFGLKGGEGLAGQGFLGSGGAFSGKRAFLTGSALATALPFMMGGGEEEEGEPETSFTETPDSIANIVEQARQQDPSLRFLPQPKFVRNFYAADGGLANIPREGYKIGGLSSLGIPGLAIKAGQKAGEMFKAGVGKVKSLFDDADINVSIRDEDVMTDAGLQAQAVGQDVFITPKSAKAIKVIDDLIEEGYDITKSSDGDYTINALDEGALDIIAQRLRLGDKSVDEVMGTLPKSVDEMDEESKMIADALRQRRADGGIMDLGGMEKDYRTGGFVELGAEERADDVPARLSKNEFVFTADAVRNAGGGDIDKGAEVMQNMMDNLEAGGNISEESQGMNPAQGMFDQAQMLEGRLA
ncbi:hypothetical protein N9U57_02565 [Candidatus Pelagibacter sp.]|nr:hypothetical protein [Candidatus Pelagibacter sp.]